jgi:uncharacterized membrane-anchored protein YjiN (DUF445 family)
MSDSEPKTNSIKEKYFEFIRRGDSISDLRSLKEEKEDRLEKIKSEINDKKKIIKYLSGEELKHKRREIDDLEERKFEVKKDIVALGEVILSKDEITEHERLESKKITLSEDYNPLKHMSAEDARDYGLDLTKLERMVKIERWLDSVYPEWFKTNIPSKVKREIEEFYENEIVKSTIESMLGQLRDKKRKNKIKERLNSRVPEWEENGVPNGVEDSLSDLLSISNERVEEYIQKISMEQM